jgi:hypothetical protein
VLFYLNHPLEVTDSIFNLLKEESLLFVSRHAPYHQIRSVERSVFECELWLLREEIVEQGTFWVLQAWCKNPPLAHLPVNIHTGVQDV